MMAIDTTDTDSMVMGKATPDKLRHIATMLDLMDVILEKVEFRSGEEVIDLTTIKGQDMQEDLRRWADEIEARHWIKDCKNCQMATAQGQSGDGRLGRLRPLHDPRHRSGGLMATTEGDPMTDTSVPRHRFRLLLDMEADDVDDLVARLNDVGYRLATGQLSRSGVAAGGSGSCIHTFTDTERDRPFEEGG